MHHPRTRAERRHARNTWRNHRRKIIVTYFTYRHEDPTQNRGWLKGGKQYTACGNRCGHRLITRWEKRQQLKIQRAKTKSALLNLDIQAEQSVLNQTQYKAKS